MKFDAGSRLRRDRDAALRQWEEMDAKRGKTLDEATDAVAGMTLEGRRDPYVYGREVGDKLLGLYGREVGDKLHELGFVKPPIRKVVIEAPQDNYVVVHVEVVLTREELRRLFE